VLERGPATSPLFKAFFRAVQEGGYQLTTDVNGFRQEGFAPFDRNIHRGRRLSAARAYLHPVMTRANLEVRCRAFVNRVIFQGTRAVGVEVREGDQMRKVFGKEVILCGGAFNSPQLLQLSGVGNADELRALGAPWWPTCPAWERTSRTTSRSTSSTRARSPVSVAPALKWRNRPMVGAKWLFLRSGPGATNHFEAGASRAATTTWPTRT
jgi:choline dehydrogenase